jgi:HK97 family phage portal protein
MPLFPSLRKTLRADPRGIRPGSGPGVPVEVKRAAGGYFTDLQRQLSVASGREWDVERAVREGYERIVWVFRPVNVIAENQRARKFQLTQGSAAVEDHPLARLLNKKANPLETGPVFRKRLSAQILLSKPGAFVEVSRTRGGEPFRLDLLPPSRVRIIPGAVGADPRELASLVDHFELVEPDGIRVRPIEPENIRWFRDPHPLDPYSGMTPLEAGGMSVELDHFARLYNVMWLRNDGRPGGIVAVKGDLDDDEMTYIERKFDKGPAAAGKLTVISSDGIEFVDPASKPRDMSYQQLARNAKIELLASFGVPETMLGYAGDRTFANAEQERLVFWQDTMPPHLAIITDGFDEDSDDDLEGSFDLSDVEVLEQVKDKKLERARAEVAAGLLSPYDYAQLSGNTSIEDTIHTRSLYIASGKTPLPINQPDADAMGLGEQDEAAAEGSGGAEGPAEDPAAAAGAAPVAAGEPMAAGGSPEGAVPAGPGAAAAALAAAGAAPVAPASGGSTDGALAALLGETKSLPGADPGARVRFRVVGKADEAAWSTDDVDETARNAVEAAVASALAELAAGWLERASARMASVKSRKGTRHWNPQGDRERDTRLATKAIDPAYAVDDTVWAAEAQEKVAPVLIAAALTAAQRTWSNLGGAGQLPQAVTSRVSDLAREAAGFVGAAAQRLGARLMAAINEADQSGLAMPKMVEAVLSHRGRLGGWAESVAVQATTASVEGARAAAAQRLAEPDDDVVVIRPVEGSSSPLADSPTGLLQASPAPALQVAQTWRARRDLRSRPSHSQADGQKQPAGGLFTVGGYLMRFPGDPLAPPSESRNCRCTVNYRARRTVRGAPRVTTPLEAAL